MTRISLRWAALILGSLLFPFSNGTNANVAAAFLAPGLLLGFISASRIVVGQIALVATLSVGSYAMFKGAIPIGHTEYLAMSLASGMAGTIPYLAHRLLAPRLDGFTATLVFPLAGVTLLYILAQGSPFGTWGHDAYVQLALPPLAQLASVTGIWGIAFIVFWFASVAQALVVSGSRPLALKAATATMTVAFVAVMAFGQARLASLPSGPTVRVAAINNPASLPDRFFDACARKSDKACRLEQSTRRADTLFALSDRAIDQGAKIVVWYESAMQYDPAYEATFIARAMAFARDRGIYLVAGAVRMPERKNALLTNKAMVFTPEGRLAADYLKSIPVPGEPIIPGNRIIPAIATPYGKLGVMICFDADFPVLSRQAAARGIDILAVPSNDWAAITPLHGEMTRMRAIENGFSVVRASSNGLSLIADQKGRVLARTNSFEQPGLLTIADVPARAIPTLQGELDDLFAGFSLLALLGLIVFVGSKTLWHRLRRPVTHPLQARTETA